MKQKSKSPKESIPQIIDSICTPELAWRREMKLQQTKNSRLTPSERADLFIKENSFLKKGTLGTFELIT